MKTNKVKEVLKFVEIYQCPGCGLGLGTGCYERNAPGVDCKKHVAGTYGTGVGKFLLGMPHGFDRIDRNTFLKMFRNFKQKNEMRNGDYDKYNIPVWKYLDEYGNTLVRGIMPRIHRIFIHIFLEDCMDKINCLEITKKDVEEMD